MVTSRSPHDKLHRARFQVQGECETQVGTLYMYRNLFRSFFFSEILPRVHLRIAAGLFSGIMLKVSSGITKGVPSIFAPAFSLELLPTVTLGILPLNATKVPAAISVGVFFF